MNTEIYNGIKTFIVLGIYFLIIEGLGLAHSSFLRLLNVFIVVYFVNKSIQSRLVEGKGFLSLFGSAFFTNLIAVVLSTMALAGYVYFFRGTSHIQTLAKPLLAIGGFDLTVSQFSFAIFAEGFASGVIISFISMQYWKNKILNMIS